MPTLVIFRLLSLLNEKQLNLNFIVALFMTGDFSYHYRLHCELWVCAKCRLLTFSTQICFVAWPDFEYGSTPILGKPPRSDPEDLTEP